GPAVAGEVGDEGRLRGALRVLLCPFFSPVFSGRHRAPPGTESSLGGQQVAHRGRACGEGDVSLSDRRADLARGEREGGRDLLPALPTGEESAEFDVVEGHCVLEQGGEDDIG